MAKYTYLTRLLGNNYEFSLWVYEFIGYIECYHTVILKIEFDKVYNTIAMDKNYSEFSDII